LSSGIDVAGRAGDRGPAEICRKASVTRIRHAVIGYRAGVEAIVKALNTRYSPTP
jgi:hypothetical protein